jgi:altronate dehydratase
MYKLIKLHERDNVAVAPMNIPENTKLEFEIISKNMIPFGHKIALSKIEKNSLIYKYGQIIGLASQNILPGEHIHSHNIAFKHFEKKSLIKKQTNNESKKLDDIYFDGFKRKNGKSGTRNYIGLLSTVNCSATVVKKIAESINKNPKLKDFKNIDGAVCLKHSSGCGMNANGYGMDVLNKTIEGFKRHPNFIKVFVVGLGCECAQISLYQNNEEEDNVVYMNIQDEGGTKKIINNISNQIIEILPDLNKEQRVKIPISELTVALQCGGSDSYSGITANPALGYASDLLINHGGSTILSETPEIYGAEHLLIERSANEEIANKLIKQIHWWKNYTLINNASLDNNPSPGNKKGGLSTILEKSLGAVAKSGTAIMQDVLGYAEPLTKKGFNFMDSPGYDPVSVTGQVASGSNIVCFTTGRGSCFGFKPTPSIKIASNTNMYNKLDEDMDINSGTIMDGESSIKEIGDLIFKSIVDTASGKLTKSEINDYGDDEFIPWIIGATL